MLEDLVQEGRNSIEMSSCIGPLGTDFLEDSGNDNEILALTKLQEGRMDTNIPSHILEAPIPSYPLLRRMLALHRF